MNVLQNLNYIVYGVQTPFEGVGGTPPYTYAVLGGGAGGTIDPTSGLYTAPNVPVAAPVLPAGSFDTIQVTDSLAATATATIEVGIALLALCNILSVATGIAANRVRLWNQKIFEPEDSGISIAVGILALKTIGNNSRFDGTDWNQSINMWNMVTIDVISRDISAVFQKEFVVMALSSLYSEQMQNANNFKIGPVPSNFVDLSQLDGMAIPYRFQISVGLQYSVSNKYSGNGFYENFQDPSVIVNE